MTVSDTTTPEASAMQTEVVFCNVCDQSIPEQAFLEGQAFRTSDGGCHKICAFPATAQEPEGSGRSPALLLGAVVVLLGGMIAGFLHLDGRLTEIDQASTASFGALVKTVEANESGQERLEHAVSAIRLGDQSEDLIARLEGLSKDLGSLRRSLPGRFDTLETSAEQARQQRRSQEQFLSQLSATISVLREDVRGVLGTINELRAQPLEDPAAGPIGTGIGGTPADPVAATGLPPELAHLVSRLDDPDSATRYEAADQLLRSGDERAFALVLPLAKDPDLFVRLVVLDGAATIRSKESVDALIVALGDPESLVRDRAIRGLQDLTGEAYPFDPDASSEQRAAMQQRWQKWWADARESF